MPNPGCKLKGGFTWDAREQGQQLGSGRSSPAPTDLLGSSRWRGCKSPHKPGNRTNLLEDKSVGEEGKLSVLPFPPSCGKRQQHPACPEGPQHSLGQRRESQRVGYLVETWFGDKQTFHLGHGKLSHKYPTQGDIAAGVSLGTKHIWCTSKTFRVLPNHEGLRLHCT